MTSIPKKVPPFFLVINGALIGAFAIIWILAGFPTLPLPKHTTSLKYAFIAFPSFTPNLKPP